MSIKDLIPWKREKRDVPVNTETGFPIHSLHRDMNRLFDDFLRGFEIGPFGSLEGGFNGLTPRVDVTETKDEIRVTAETPGMDEKNLDISISHGHVTIKGEKREEHEENDKEYYRMERSYGSFHRTVPLPAEVDEDKVEAKYSKGVLTITLPKTEEARRKPKRIGIKSA